MVGEPEWPRVLGAPRGCSGRNQGVSALPGFGEENRSSLGLGQMGVLASGPPTDLGTSVSALPGAPADFGPVGPPLCAPHPPPLLLASLLLTHIQPPHAPFRHLAAPSQASSSMSIHRQESSPSPSLNITSFIHLVIVYSPARVSASQSREHAVSFTRVSASTE